MTSHNLWFRHDLWRVCWAAQSLNNGSGTSQVLQKSVAFVFMSPWRQWFQKISRCSIWFPLKIFLNSFSFIITTKNNLSVKKEKGKMDKKWHIEIMATYFLRIDTWLLMNSSNVSHNSWSLHNLWRLCCCAHLSHNGSRSSQVLHKWVALVFRFSKRQWSHKISLSLEWLSLKPQKCYPINYIYKT